MSTLCFLRVILVFLCCHFLTVFTCLKCGLRFFERSCLMCRASHLVCLKDPEKPFTSFLSSSSTSASWPEQISPLEPFKDSSAREASSFDALGVRPKQKPPASSGSEAGDNSGRSTPVYHHYHHHFHHTQPQGTVPGIKQMILLKTC